ncbi:hypothetical protein [Kineococcus aurantiacus]|uniref:Uncharacterized protein n=1 Tax=Kineococcus aurantiacus TaxID=37633 RepID=A0A7Y9AVH9_9ACTN|nr:hypothetical protein [Kineococcus aurantiacus]NYD21375.1 hypothetical protein [Kineococcus aurantiacus]
MTFHPNRLDVVEATDDPTDESRKAHALLLVRSSLSAEAIAEHLPTWSAETVQARRVAHAGVLARVGLFVEHEVDKLRRNHNCGWWCGLVPVEGFPTITTDRDAPTLGVRVPKDDADEWVERLQHLVELVQRNDSPPAWLAEQQRRPPNSPDLRAVR